MARPYTPSWIDRLQSALERVSTWPWRPETPRLLATALLLPLVVFLGQRGLSQFLGL